MFPLDEVHAHMTTHQQDSSQPQQSHDSPQETGLGLMMVEIEEATLAGILTVSMELVESEQCQWGHVIVDEACPQLVGDDGSVEGIWNMMVLLICRKIDSCWGYRFETVSIERRSRPLYRSLGLPITPKQLGPALDSRQLSGWCNRQMLAKQPPCSLPKFDQAPLAPEQPRTASSVSISNSYRIAKWKARGVVAQLTDCRQLSRTIGSPK
jgi:hypothetical protein